MAVLRACWVLGWRLQVLREFGCPAVMFGHHQGDLQENVISNVMRGCGPLQLSGMSKQSTVNKVGAQGPQVAASAA